MKTLFQSNQIADDDQLKFLEKVFNNHQISRINTRENIPSKKNVFLSKLFKIGGLQTININSQKYDQDNHVVFVKQNDIVIGLLLFFWRRGFRGFFFDFWR